MTYHIMQQSDDMELNPSFDALLQIMQKIMIEKIFEI